MEAKQKYLSVLRNAGPGAITYYVGTDPAAIAHLRDCTLICHHELQIPEQQNIEAWRVDDPQLEFYKLSAEYKKEYMHTEELRFDPQYRSYIHPEAEIGENVRIGPGCAIDKVKIGNNVRIDANVVLYAETVIGDNSIIESNSSIGASGIIWAWDGKKRVYLEMLGNVEIQNDVFIGANCEVSRASANETTVIGRYTCVAHGSKFGHGCVVGEYNHFANNVSFGGSVRTGSNCFFGCGVTVAPRSVLGDNIITGSGAVIVKDAPEPGIYVGLPARKIREATGKHRGVPKWQGEE